MLNDFKANHKHFDMIADKKITGMKGMLLFLEKRFAIIPKIPHVIRNNGHISF